MSESPEVKPIGGKGSDYDIENIFAKIIDGKMPCFKVFENRFVIAILDAFPQAEGHTLVIPKIKGYKSIMDMPARVLCDCMSAVPIVAKAVKNTTGCEGVNIIANNGAAAGQTVFHPHFHLIPRFADDKKVLNSAGTKLEEEAGEEMKKKMIAALEAGRPTKPKPPLRKPKYSKITDLQPSKSGLNMVVKVTGEPKEVKNSKNPKADPVFEITAADETGTVILSLRKMQLETCTVGATIDLRNFFVQMVAGHMRVVVDKWGKISTAAEEDVIAETKEEPNVSAVEYELVK